MNTHIDDSHLDALLGVWAGALIRLMAREAHHAGIALYLVGGMVRDLLLGRANHDTDIDFTIEGDAIAFARRLHARFGGRLEVFPPFGTAKWRLAGAVLPLAFPNDTCPIDHLDFAMTRAESYARPGALPTVRPASLHEDLHRRDFTINTLAVRLEPEWGSILDLFGGLADLRTGFVRALHPLSFVDDPTRLIRAWRFAHRLGFALDPHTAEWMRAGLDVLPAVTGERLRNELTLMLGEPRPARGMERLAAEGILTRIHPLFTLPADLEKDFAALDEHAARQPPPDIITSRWLVILAALTEQAREQVGARLLFPAHTLSRAGGLRALLDGIEQVEHRPSALTALCEAHHAAHPLLHFTLAALLEPPDRARVQQFIDIWQHTRPIANGDSLRALGLRPGRCFGVILSRLRKAWLDGEISTESEENALIAGMIASGICD
jgi:tRNA nucleotidyltransferase (CCA-adding enzyme)